MYVVAVGAAISSPKVITTIASQKPQNWLLNPTISIEIMYRNAPSGIFCVARSGLKARVVITCKKTTINALVVGIQL